MSTALSSLPIGVFDSGVGGLTVLSALQAQLPNESFIYLGDTARIPYGTKSRSSVSLYAKHACQFLKNEQIKCLVIACNTATALALPDLEKTITDLPIVGVIEPGAETAVATTRTGRIAVLGTEATIQANSYQHAIHRRRPDLQVIGQSCTMFVALAEEGWTHGAIAEATAHVYLDPLLQAHSDLDTILLGCTHFPVFKDTIARVVGNTVQIIDSALATARHVEYILQTNGLFHHKIGQAEKTRFFVTDAPDRFLRVASRFIQMDLSSKDVSWVDLYAPPEDVSDTAVA